MTSTTSPTSDVCVVIGTYGDIEWSRRAQAAVQSVKEQTVWTEWVQLHADTLQLARNYGAMHVRDRYNPQHLIFLDADDTLDPHYVEEMLRGAGDLRQPSTLGVYPDGSTDDEPALIEPAPAHRGGLLYRNHLVIGSMVRAQLFFDVGMFNDLPILEDWDLWIRCWQAGAKITQVPEAIYRVGVNEDSRNNQPVDHNWVYRQIREKYGKKR